MNEQKLINLIGEIGRLLLKHGAEIYRVEESLLRMCKSYNYENVDPNNYIHTKNETSTIKPFDLE